MQNPNLLFIIAAVASATAFAPSAKAHATFYAQGLYTGPSTTVGGIAFESGVTTYTEFFTLNSLGGGSFGGTAYETITTGASTFTTPTVAINSVGYGSTSTPGLLDGVSLLYIDAGTGPLDFGFNLDLPDSVTGFSLFSLTPYNPRLYRFLGDYDAGNPFTGTQTYAFAGDSGSTPTALGVTPVPEPSTLVLGVAGLIAGVTAARLRRSASALA